jgi:hypothetical protein
MNNFPITIKASPIPATIENKKAFLMIVKNASLQETQKLLLVIAH